MILVSKMTEMMIMKVLDMIMVKTTTIMAKG